VVSFRGSRSWRSRVGQRSEARAAFRPRQGVGTNRTWRVAIHVKGALEVAIKAIGIEWVGVGGGARSDVRMNRARLARTVGGGTETAPPQDVS
jgi:hypothetical protein